MKEKKVSEMDREHLENLQQMQLLVFPVTWKLLTTSNYAFRRKGIGMLAMKCLMEREWKFTLHVMKNNEPAQKFWRAVKQELNLDDWHEENFLKIETEDTFCDFFYWESRMMKQLLDGAFTYHVTTPFPVGSKIYKSVSDLKVRKHEVFDAWYDRFDRLVVIDDDELTGKRYHMILDGEDSIIVFEDRTQVYVVTDPDFIVEEELFESLNTKVGNMKEYLEAFQKWQRERQFTARREFYKSPWDDKEEEDLFFRKSEPRHRHHKFRRCSIKRKQRRIF